MDLFYRKMGQGPPMIILHGLYGSSDNWFSIGKAFSDKFEVYLIDQRNHGSSPHTREHNYIALRNDLHEFMEAHNLEKAVILGHSMGGKAAMFFAVAWPEMVQSLIVVDISPRSYKSLLQPVSQSLDHMNIINSMMSVDFSEVKDREDIDRILAETLSSEKLRQFLLKNVKRNKEGGYEWKLNIKTLHNQLPQILDGLDHKPFMNGNGITGFPVLFIKAEKSGYIKEDDIAIIKTIFPMAEMVTIPGADHWVHVEKPELLIKTISYFVFGAD
jgi:pimeloyl-ACP methyl ester carboxylesterase